MTGAAGFIGSHLVDRLLDAEHEVVGIDAFTDYYPRRYKEANIARAMEHDAFHLVRSDLLELAGYRLADIFAGADCVYHLAGQAGVRASWGSSFRAYSENNVLGTQVVLEACRTAAVPRLVYASSSSVYGSVDAMPLREDAVCRPVSPYGVTKLAGEHLCTLYAAQYGIHTVSLRFFSVFGARQRPDMAFHRFVRALLQGQALTVFGDGDQTRDFTAVRDIVVGLLNAPLAPAASVINVGGGHRVTLNQAIDALEAITERPARRERHEAQAGDVRDTWADLGRAQALLGYRPVVPLEVGLAEEVEWVAGLPSSISA